MIRIEHLTKQYGALTALDDVSLTIGKGEIVGLLGPNGAGKSTMMNILTGFLSLTSGSVAIDGSDVADDPMGAKKKIGYLPEIPPLYPDMTVTEYLTYIYELKKCTLPRAAHLSEICETVKIADVRGRLIKHLSKGYRQRVGIAAALVGEPPLILLDEPTVGLDPRQIIEIRQLIRTLGKKHTVVLSTHILQEVQAVCDRVVIINKGKIVADEKTATIGRVANGARTITVKIAGPSKDVNAALRAVSGVSSVELLSERDGDAAAYRVVSDERVDIRKRLFFAMAERGFPIVGMEDSGASLEDAFLSVVEEKRAPGRAQGRRD